MSSCNNFIIFSLQQSLSSISDNVEIGGPCPLTAAFILSQGGLGNGTSKTALNTSLIPNQKKWYALNFHFRITLTFWFECYAFLNMSSFTN